MFTLSILIHLFSVTKPTKRAYNIHNSTVFYLSNIFQHYYAVFREFAHQVLKTRWYMIVYIRNIVYIAFRGYVQLSRWWYTKYVIHYRSNMYLQLYTILDVELQCITDHVCHHSANWNLPPNAIYTSITNVLERIHPVVYWLDTRLFYIYIYTHTYICVCVCV
jgi:hypothetical protein